MTKTNDKNDKNNKNKNILGGKVIASGGFGCVFSPALKCEGQRERSPNTISKLMTERHAIEEYEEIAKIKQKLDSIKNYKDYYLIHDSKLCKPAKLSESDLQEFTKKCSALPKNNITKKNINQSLDKVMTLNLPDGGVAIDTYIYGKGSIDDLQNLNNKLIALLENGILPMNKKNIYHCDIKDSNVLAKEDNTGKLITRLIDWGLSTEYVPFKDAEFPRTWRNRPFQFNVPFSVIIFSDDFIEKYTKYIQEGGKSDKVHLKPFVIDFIHFWLKERGAGHYKFINDIMFMLFSKDLNMEDTVKAKFIESDFTVEYITNYIVAILEKFTEFRKNGRLNLRTYLDTVFVKIVDIYGFICIYFPLLEILYENYDKLNENQLKIFNLIKNMFVTYLYSPRTEPINVKSLVFDLKNLGKLLGNEGTTVTTARGIENSSRNSKNIVKKNKKTVKNNRKNNRSELNFKRKKKFLTRRLKKYLMLS